MLKRTAWGSWKSPANPHIVPSWEYVLIFIKGKDSNGIKQIRMVSVFLKEAGSISCLLASSEHRALVSGRFMKKILDCKTCIIVPWLSDCSPQDPVVELSKYTEAHHDQKRLVLISHSPVIRIIMENFAYLFRKPCIVSNDTIKYGSIFCVDTHEKTIERVFVP